jgi:drug/metabolite transporter (DMT)-like permease
MSQFGVLAALGASLAWAFASVLSFKPAAKLGALAFTRIQLVSSGIVLVALAVLSGSWASIDWQFWPSLLVSSVIGVVGPNLAFAACLTRTGPGFAQILFSTRTPITALLGFLFFSQALSGNAVIGVALVSVGVAVVASGGAAAPAGTRAAGLWTGLLFGFIAAAGNAVGVIVLLPAVDAGVHPLALSAVRTGAAALILLAASCTPWLRAGTPQGVTMKDLRSAIFPGFLGYVVAVTLQLWSLLYLEAGVSAALSSLAPVLILPIMWSMTRKPIQSVAWIGAVAVCAGVALLRA